MADNGASAHEVAAMVEKPWKYTNQWDALTAGAEVAAEDARLVCGWDGAGSDTPNGDMEVGRG
jgi:hypothetical protein